MQILFALPLLYVFRRQLWQWAIQTAFVGYRLVYLTYTTVRKLVAEGDGYCLHAIVDVSDGMSVYEYHVRHNHHQYIARFFYNLNDSAYDQRTLITGHMQIARECADRMFELDTRIVHACINVDDVYIADVTADLRSFRHYWDCTPESHAGNCVTVGMFLQYVRREQGVDIENKHYSLTVYHNNASMTSSTFALDDIKDKPLSHLFG